MTVNLAQMISIVRMYPITTTIDGTSFPDTLGGFVDSNDKTDPEINAAVQAILQNKPFHGGGGAAAEWSIRPR